MVDIQFLGLLNATLQAATLLFIASLGELITEKYVNADICGVSAYFQQMCIKGLLNYTFLGTLCLRCLICINN